MPPIPGSLRALMANLIDYAGLYPPAALPLPVVLRNYRDYMASPDAWMLNRLVLPAARLAEAPAAEGWRITLLVDSEPGPLPAPVETLETRLPGRLSLPTYCEAPLESIQQDAFAKVRTGGPAPESVPPSDALAAFLCQAARRRIPWKATAGLHHPLRGAAHGFVNVFVAAAFAWHGAAHAEVSDILNGQDPSAFRFLDAELRWRGRPLATEALHAARRDFAHSFGSCSFEEPLAGLRALGWMPA